MRKTVQLLQEFSIPLIAGVVVALIWANVSPHSYHEFIEKELFFGANFHFLVNDIFMLFFFAIAGVEITQSVLPGGDLNPIKKAINPLYATLGGVLGPVAVYLSLNALIGSPELVRGWGIPTATDIALAWLVARFVFGAAHPAVKFLLLLAIADDAIGLFIIAVFYPDPTHPTEPIWLLLVLAGMALAFILRKMKVRNYWPYILGGGILSWTGLHNAHLHPALALVFIVPFLPHPAKETGRLFEEDLEEHSTLSQFEHEWKVIVDFGLFFFGLANAGVEFSEIGTATWLVFFGLLVGKTVGIYLLGNLAKLLGFPLPNGMGQKELFLAGLVAAIGLTVALFVAGAAFTNPEIQGAAKMGALFSGANAILAIILGKVLRIQKVRERENPA
ncbi:Na+/H+ antiporter NhaA [Calderihabitans maritimus]|uniref:Na(+)/H(+) antiporter NhaA n=1 Tax=Calderihabitans maritimus TaxID=1246530 RepID=A0A1Z5HTE3_9FIRM|nr:Na+/H+ antiporter NhaA [Calderihabitans maritimus]GAW92540.1 sodium/proton antiporter family protein [Calderihabitans maritimus]